MDDEKLHFGSQILTYKMENFFMNQSILLREITSKKLLDRSDRIRPLLMSIPFTCKGISILARDGLLNESTMLFRALLEKVINACYLLICDEEDINQYFLYTPQKAIRRLNREAKAGNHTIKLKYTGINSVTMTNLQESIKKFTSTMFLK